MKKSFAVFAAIMGGVLAFAACGGKEGSLTKKQCAKVFGEVASVLLEGEPSKPVNTVAPLAYHEAEDYGNVNGTGAFVYVVGEVLKNDKFQVYDAPSRFTCSYEEDFYDLNMLVSYQPSAGSVGGEIRGKNTRSDSDGVDYFYLTIDVNYDFEKDKIVSFELGMVNWLEDAGREYLANKYQGGVLYELDTYEKDAEYDACAQSLDALEKAFSAKTAKDLKADFSEEYARSLRLVETE